MNPDAIPEAATLPLRLADEAATTSLGSALADALRSHWSAITARGLQIELAGELGAGKTTLVRALLRRLGVDGPVKSPTFSLLEPYVVSSLNLYHFDFYRFEHPDEFTEAGFRELFGAGTLALVEWPEKAAGQLPAPDLVIRLAHEGEGRKALLIAHTEIAAACLAALRASWNAPAAAG